jgi:glycosyltransferase involved in cell wall biosynthesis
VEPVIEWTANAVSETTAEAVVTGIKRRTVSIVYRFLPQYRVEFFEGLRSRLGGEGIDLRLFYGKNERNLKLDERDLNWATVVSQLELNIFGKQVLFQRLPASIYDSSLIILMQENKILSNYPLALRARKQGIRVALWGHGINFQAKPNSIGNWCKRRLSPKVDWWFAYTSKVARLLSTFPFPEDRITIVNNAIDTRRLMNALSNVTEMQRHDLRDKLRLGAGPVGIYCGSMYPDKRLPFLFEACEKVREVIPEFDLILIGAGPDSTLVEDFARSRDWIHYVGPKFSLDRVPYFSLSHAFLMPGLVGLAVLDSFALGTPIITTKYPRHSPEIEYIENGRNGLISEDDVSAYAEAVIEAIADPRVLPRLRKNARKDAEKYTVEAMISNFVGGILKVIAAPLAP